MAYQPDIEKIDDVATNGLSGVSNSLAYRVEEIEKHLHSSGRCFGATGAPGVGPGLLTSLLPFKAVTSATASTYGSSIVVFNGTEDFDLTFTPVYTDPHKILVTDVSDSGIWKLRMANSGWNGSANTYATMAEAVTANKYSEFIIKVDSTKADAVALSVQTGRMRIGSTLWAQVMHDDSGAETMKFLICAHGYVG